MGAREKINSDNKVTSANRLLHEIAVVQSPSHRRYENFHQSNTIRMKPTAPSGAYWRIIALMLIFLAAFRYFSDSDRRDVERCDIPSWRCQFQTCH